MESIEQIAINEFDKVGDDGLFPNHTDKDIWVSGFKAGFEYKCQAVNSDTRLYQQAGNTITVSVIQAIIKNLLHILK